MKFGQAEFDAAKKRCKSLWRTTMRGGLTDFDEFFSRVLFVAWQSPPPDGVSFETHIGTIGKHAITNMQREAKRDADIAAHLAFEAQRPATGDVLPASFEVPYERRGGARPGAGRPRKNSNPR